MAFAALGYMILCVNMLPYRTTAYQWVVYLGIRFGLLNVSRWLHPLDRSFLQNLPNLSYWDYVEWVFYDISKRDMAREFIDLFSQDDPKKMLDFTRPITPAHTNVRHAMEQRSPAIFDAALVEFLKIWATRMSLGNLSIVHDTLQDERLRDVMYEEINRRSVLDIFDL